MKIATYHNRVTRNEFTFSTNDLIEAAKRYVCKKLGKPPLPSNAHEEWNCESGDGHDEAFILIRELIYDDESGFCAVDGGQDKPSETVVPSNHESTDDSN